MTLMPLGVGTYPGVTHVPAGGLLSGVQTDCTEKAALPISHSRDGNALGGVLPFSLALLIPQQQRVSSEPLLTSAVPLQGAELLELLLKICHLHTWHKASNSQNYQFRGDSCNKAACAASR